MPDTHKAKPPRAIVVDAKLLMDRHNANVPDRADYEFGPREFRQGAKSGAYAYDPTDQDLEP